jgi:hypothetical protein
MNKILFTVNWFSMFLSDIPRVISLAFNGRVIPEISKTFLAFNQIFWTKLQFQNRCNKFSLVSWIPHLYSNELTGKILCNCLNWKFCSFVYLVIQIVGCPTNDFCEFALTELHTPVWYIVGMRRTSCIEIKMSSLCIVVTFFLNWGQRSRSKNWN